MNEQAATEFATGLRKLLRRADRFGYGLQTLKEEVLLMAENYEEVADRAAMEKIVQAQRDWVENHG